MIVFQTPLDRISLGIANALLAHNVKPGTWNGGVLPPNIKHLFISDSSKFGYSQMNVAQKNDTKVWFCGIDVPKSLEGSPNAQSINPACTDSYLFRESFIDDDVEYDVLLLNPVDDELDNKLDQIKGVCAVVGNDLINSKYYKGYIEDSDLISLAKKAKIVVDNGERYWDLRAHRCPVISSGGVDADLINQILDVGVAQTDQVIPTFEDFINELGILRK